jgi:tRNA (adenine22-N1)-methyltransferase
MKEMLPTNPAPITLDERLSAVASLARGPRLADIGSDHALLPRYLLEQGIARHVIAVEKNEGPAEIAREALRGYSAEVRLGDGFDALRPAEVDCATLCGLGGWLIASLLCRYPERLPARLVLQANRDTPLLRVWASESGYHLVAEKMVAGYWSFPILALEKAGGPDPAYRGLPRQLANEFGPHLLKERHPLLCQDVLERELYFRNTRAVSIHRLLLQARDHLRL